MPSGIVQRLEAARKEQSISVKKLSEITGIPESTYNNIISGRSQKPSYDCLRIIAVALKIPPAEFYYDGDAETSEPSAEYLQEAAALPATQHDFNHFAEALIRISDQQAADFRAATESRNAHFAKALEDLHVQFNNGRNALIAQFDRERAMLTDRIRLQQRWIALSSSFCVLFLFTSLALFIHTICK